MSRSARFAAGMLSEHWRAYIGDGDEEGHDDAVEMGQAIAGLLEDLLEHHEQDELLQEAVADYIRASDVGLGVGPKMVAFRRMRAAYAVVTGQPTGLTDKPSTELERAELRAKLLPNDPSASRELAYQRHHAEQEAGIR